MGGGEENSCLDSNPNPPCPDSVRIKDRTVCCQKKKGGDDRKINGNTEGQQHIQIRQGMGRWNCVFVWKEEKKGGEKGGEAMSDVLCVTDV